jgi:protein TonB
VRQPHAAALALSLAVCASVLPLHAQEPRAELDLVPTPPSVATRIEQIRQRVQAAIVYPQAARERGIEGTARIQFRVDAAGRAADVTTVETSGSGLLDRAAEQAARDARELPQISGFVRIPVQFALTGRATSQRPSSTGSVVSR